MENRSACASCASTHDLRTCRRCRTVSYCSTSCQRAHWQRHRATCHFQVATSEDTNATTDALSLLRTIPDPGTTLQQNSASAAKKLFNISELRLTVFSNLPASDLLRTQRVCRSWYQTIAFEPKLQQRLFLAPGPGELVLPARADETTFLGIQPRNESQRGFAFGIGRKMSGYDLYQVTNSAESIEEVSAAKIEESGKAIILNPFFTSLWPQDPSNMTSSPHLTVSAIPQTASWRRMYLTSPPITSLGLNLWYTKSNGKGSQLVPSTGHVPSGVRLGHLADMLAAQPPRLTYHWMQPQGQAWWLRSTDAVVVPQEGETKDIEARRGVYVNPSNGIAFPGAF